jgi:GTPase SAR1 family protein
MGEDQPPSILVIVGASAVGKTTAVETLARRRLPGVVCHHFDSIGVPSAEEMARRFGSGERWQAAMTDQWVERLRTTTDAAVAVLEGQTRPTFVRAALAPHPVARTAIILLDCSPAVRRERLSGQRRQPDLATSQMDSWTAYLRGEADALDLPVIDTSTLDPGGVSDQLAAHIDRLRSIQA